MPPHETDITFDYNNQFSFDINIPLSTVNCTAFLMESNIIQNLICSTDDIAQETHEVLGTLCIKKQLF